MIILYYTQVEHLTKQVQKLQSIVTKGFHKKPPVPTDRRAFFGKAGLARRHTNLAWMKKTLDTFIGTRLLPRFVRSV